MQLRRPLLKFRLAVVRFGRHWWARYWLGLGVLCGLHLLYSGYLTPLPLSTDTARGSAAEIVPLLKGAWAGGSRPTQRSSAWMERPGLCWVCGYRGGYEQVFELSLWRDRVRAVRDLLSIPSLHEMEAVEFGFGTSCLPYDEKRVSKDKSGLSGILLRCSQGDLLLPPAEFPRTGEFPDGQVARYQQERRVLREAEFQGQVFLLRRSQGFQPVELARGEPVLALQSVSRGSLGRAALEAAMFLQRLIRLNNGQLPFSYDPVTGHSSEDGRSLQDVCCGSLALARWARHSRGESDRALALHQIETLVARYVHPLPVGCVVSDSEDGSLGSQALLALAIHDLPRPTAVLRRVEEGLALTILQSQQPDGHFETRLHLPGSALVKPIDPETDDRQFTEGGEALCYLSKRATERNDRRLLRSVDISLEYYRARFRRHPDRRAASWLVSACALRALAPGGDVASQMALDLVSWNLHNLQSWASEEQFLRGAPINPSAKSYGPTCPSSEAAAELGGLVAVEKLSRRGKESRRAEVFSGDILEVSRYLLQMQNREESDLYWMSPDLRKQALGGIRENIWNQTMEGAGTATALLSWLSYLEGGSG